MVKDSCGVIFGKLFRLNIDVEGLAANRENEFRRTFDIYSHSFWVSADLSGNKLPLIFLIKWNIHHFLGSLISANQHLWDIFAVFKKEINKSNLDRLSFWDIAHILVIHFDSHISV